MSALVGVGVGVREDIPEIILDDLRCVRDEDRVMLYLTPKGRHGNSIQRMIDELQSKSTKAGAKFGALKSTYRDVKHPVIILTIKGRVQGPKDKLWKDVITSFIIRREDLYLCGYCVHKENMKEDCWRIPANWKMCRGNPVKLNGAQRASFGVSYEDSDHLSEEQKQNLGKYAVGKSVLLENLNVLHKDDTTDHGTAFHSICYHIAEAARFSPISESVRATFNKGRTKQGITDQHSKFTSCWRKLSTAHLHNTLYHEDCSEDWWKDLKIEHVDMITRHLRIMVRESDSTREKRRMNDQSLHSVVMRKVFKPKPSYRKKQVNLRPKGKDCEWTKLRQEQLDKQRDKQHGRDIIPGKLNEIRCNGMWMELQRLMDMEDPYYFRVLLSHIDINIVHENLTRLKDDFNNDYHLSANVRTYK